MNLDRFTVFAAVAKYRSMSRASEELFISQPAVSKHLRLLEENYKTKLYARGGKGIELTEAGRIFLRSVKTIFRQHERLKQTLSTAISGSKDAVLTVGGSYGPSASLLPSLMARFRKSHPGVQLHLRTADRLVVERMILNGEIDLAVLNNPPRNRHLTMVPYRSEPLVAFVAPNHALARKGRANWEDLKRLGIIFRKPSVGKGMTERFVQSLKKTGREVKVVMHCESPEAVKTAVREEMGIGLLIKDIIEDSIRRREFREIKLPGETIEGKSFIVYHKTRPLSPLAQDFHKLLRTQRDKLRS